MSPKFKKQDKSDKSKQVSKQSPWVHWLSVLLNSP